MVLIMVFAPALLDCPSRPSLRRHPFDGPVAPMTTLRPLSEIEHLTIRFGGLLAVDDCRSPPGRARSPHHAVPTARDTTVLPLHHRLLASHYGRLMLRGRPKSLLERMLWHEIVAYGRGLRATSRMFSAFPAMTVLENLLVAQHNKRCSPQA